jgi:YD repeat-containing protein
MTYDSRNNLTAMVDARGITTTYTYSGSLLLSSMDGLGHTTTYTYTTAADAPQPPGLLKAVTDPRGIPPLTPTTSSANALRRLTR